MNSTLCLQSKMVSDLRRDVVLLERSSDIVYGKVEFWQGTEPKRKRGPKALVTRYAPEKPHSSMVRDEAREICGGPN